MNINKYHICIHNHSFPINLRCEPRSIVYNITQKHTCNIPSETERQIEEIHPKNRILRSLNDVSEDRVATEGRSWIGRDVVHRRGRNLSSKMANQSTQPPISRRRRRRRRRRCRRTVGTQNCVLWWAHGFFNYALFLFLHRPQNSPSLFFLAFFFYFLYFCFGKVWPCLRPFGSI